MGLGAAIALGWKTPSEPGYQGLLAAGIITGIVSVVWAILVIIKIYKSCKAWMILHFFTFLYMNLLNVVILLETINEWVKNYWVKNEKVRENWNLSRILRLFFNGYQYLWA